MVNNEIGERNGELRTLPAAARALGLPVKILRREARAGSFPTYAAGGVRRRVLLAEVQAWVRLTRVEPATEEAVAHADGVVTRVINREMQRRRLPTDGQPDSRERLDQENARSPPATLATEAAIDSDFTET